MSLVSLHVLAYGVPVPLTAHDTSLNDSRDGKTVDRKTVAFDRKNVSKAVDGKTVSAQGNFRHGEGCTKGNADCLAGLSCTADCYMNGWWDQSWRGERTDEGIYCRCSSYGVPDTWPCWDDFDCASTPNGGECFRGTVCVPPQYENPHRHAQGTGYNAPGFKKVYGMHCDHARRRECTKEPGSARQSR